ncbi:MAG TPA: hypothetical protein PLJ23_07930 [Gemmatimonadales bacterium]|nr:hypothetical protein [Gemmatimonadales bacterium]
MMRHAMLRLAALTALIAGCDNAGEDLTLPPLRDGGIAVGLYLDRDGNGSFTPLDTVFSGVRVALLAAGGVDTIQVVTSDASGTALFTPVPIGSYRVVVDRAALGDSIGTVVGDSGTIRLLARNDSLNGSRLVRLSYDEVTIAEARALPAGRRVLVRGIVLSPLQAFRDASMYLRDGTGTLRITAAAHRPGRTGNNVGDSVAVLGTTGSALGQPALVGGLVSSLGQGTVLTPEAVTVAELRTARGGLLDAAFVLVTGAKITDTTTVAPDFRVGFLDAADSASRATALMDSVLQVPKPAFVEGRTITVRGMLVPRGDGTWLVKPRFGSDITISN